MSNVSLSPTQQSFVYFFVPLSNFADVPPTEIDCHKKNSAELQTFFLLDSCSHKMLRLAGMREAELTAVDCSPVTERVWGCSACLHAPVPFTFFFFLIIKSRRAGQRSRSLIISTWPAPMFVCVLPQKPHCFQAFKPSWSDTEGRLVFKPTRIIINNKFKKTLTSFSGRLSLKLFPHSSFPPHPGFLLVALLSPFFSSWQGGKVERNVF